MAPPELSWVPRATAADTPPQGRARELLRRFERGGAPSPPPIAHAAPPPVPPASKRALRLTLDQSSEGDGLSGAALLAVARTRLRRAEGAPEAAHTWQ
jgi:hypothetical protein